MNERTRKAMTSSKNSNWETPQYLYDYLNYHFGPFTLDPAAKARDAKCETFYTKSQDGLVHSWAGHKVFVNPPYGRELRPWTEKMVTEHINNGIQICALLPSRTSELWFHNNVRTEAQRLDFVGRISFELQGVTSTPALFPSCVALYGYPDVSERFPFNVIHVKEVIGNADKYV